jgi:hypothetical protein
MSGSANSAQTLGWPQHVPHLDRWDHRYTQRTGKRGVDEGALNQNAADLQTSNHSVPADRRGFDPFTHGYLLLSGSYCSWREQPWNVDYVK